MNQTLLCKTGWISWSGNRISTYPSNLKSTGFHVADTALAFYSDDSVNLQLKDQNDAFCLNYLSNQFETIQEKLIQLAIPFSNQENRLHIHLNLGFSVTIHSGNSIDLCEIPLTQLRTADVDTLYQPNLHPNKILGLFGEIAVSVADLNENIEIFNALGFRNTELHQGPYPWGIITDGIHTIGLHELEETLVPGLVYYSPVMENIVHDFNRQGLSVDIFQQKLGGLTTWKLEFSPMHLFYLCQM